jgi:outer membrane biosynthesis protein TonB
MDDPFEELIEAIATSVPEEVVKLKAPRKPRPSEIAAKAAKLKKPKPKKTAVKKKLVKTAKKQAPARKAKRSVPKKVKKTAKAGGVRFERLNFRVTKAEKAKLKARAKAGDCTITDVLVKLIEKIK